ncbi:polyprenyl synthetase family protein [Apibacter sp. HY039]|uniref:polyprenyl synthetase family protein n=1 Tax=Apibacter sp. HY039 TaxID=2501476 RepID=UPI000FEB9A5B|nr:polyprenyl synthetase family protein [Apibacter sp. HY039]
MSFLDKYKVLVEDAIDQYKLKDQPVQLYEPINYILGLGGKQLRPVLLLMACDLFNGDLKSALKPALGIEYFHNFSLMHDDIMDKAPLRRGKETVHKKYDENTAILSGDALLVKSFQMLEDLNPDLLKSCFLLFTKTALGVCEGQQYDMNFESQQAVSFDEYIHMISGKTAVLCACSLKMGSIIANADDENADYMYEFGRYLGIAFQLMDDYLDVFGVVNKVGKKHAGDITENKKTVLYLLAVQNADEKQLERLTYWFSRTDDSIEKISEVIKIYKELKIDDQCLELVRFYTNKSFAYLSKINVSDDKKKPFYQLVDYLLVRQN